MEDSRIAGSTTGILVHNSSAQVLHNTISGGDGPGLELIAGVPIVTDNVVESQAVGLRWHAAAKPVL